MSKKQFVLSSAMESIEDADTAAFIEELSEGAAAGTPEQQSEISSELSEEIETHLEENDRVLDTVDALENLVEIIKTLPEELSPSEQALIQSNLQMAVAGTDGSPSDILPSVESFNNRTVAMEGISDSIKNAISSVFHSNDVILNKTERRFSMFLSQVSKIKDRISEWNEFLNDITDKDAEDFTIYLGRHVEGSAGIVTTRDDLMKSYFKDTELLRTLIESVEQNGVVIDGLLSSALRSFTSRSKYKETLENSYTTVRNDFLGKLASKKPFTKKQDKGNVTLHTTDNLLGMNKFVISVPKTESLVDLSSKEIGSAISGLDFAMVRDPGQATNEQRKKFQFAPFRLSEIKELISDIEETNRQLYKFALSQTNLIKNRRNLFRNINKAVSIISSNFMLGVAAGTVAPALLRKGATATAAGMAGMVAAGRVAPTLVAKSADINVDLNGFIMGLISNTLRLQNRISKFFNRATNGVGDALVDHINLGNGIMDHALRCYYSADDY